MLARLAAHALYGVPLALAHGLFQLVQAVLVLVALEHRGNGGAQLLYQLLDVGAQYAAHAGRQQQMQRLGRLLEIVAVGDIRRGRLVVRALGEKTPHQLVLAVARVAQHIQIEPFAAHGGAEVQRVAGAVVAAQHVQRLQLAGHLEIEGILGAGAIDLRDVQRVGHRIFSFPNTLQYGGAERKVHDPGQVLT